MELIKNNYIIIIIIGLFLVFALIGYLIDILRNPTNEEPTVEIPESIKSIELTKVIEKNNKVKTEELATEEQEDKDDLLKNYEEEQ